MKTYTVTQTVSNVGGSASYSQTVTPIHTAAPISSPTVSPSTVSYSNDSAVVDSPVSHSISVGTSGVDFKQYNFRQSSSYGSV